MENWRVGIGTEAAAIKFVQEKAPSAPVPTVLADYIDKKAGRAYTLVSNVSGEDLNENWKKMNGKQQEAVVNQVVAHVVTLARLKSDRLVSTEGLRIYEPYLSLYDPEEPIQEPGSLIMSQILDPNKSKAYEEIWAARPDTREEEPEDKPEDKPKDERKAKPDDRPDDRPDNRPDDETGDKTDDKPDDESDKPFAFYHADLGPTNIKVKIEMEEAKVTGILDWEIAGSTPPLTARLQAPCLWRTCLLLDSALTPSQYLPIEWIGTKPMVSPGLDFVWNGEGDEQEWRRRLAEGLGDEGFDEYHIEYMAWMYAIADAQIQRYEKALLTSALVTGPSLG